MNESFIQTYLFFKIYINSIHFELMNYIWYKSNKQEKKKDVLVIIYNLHINVIQLYKKISDNIASIYK